MEPTPPSPEAVCAARAQTGLTQAQAAGLVYLGNANRWGEYERGIERMDAARFELFLVKTGQHAEYRPARGVPVPKARKAKPKAQP